MNGSTKVSDLKSRVLVSISKDNLALLPWNIASQLLQRKSNFRSFFPDSLANSDIIKEDKGMQTIWQIALLVLLYQFNHPNKCHEIEALNQNVLF